MTEIGLRLLQNEENAKEERGQLVGVVLDSIKQVKELENGYGLRFGPGLQDLILVTNWLRLERVCHSFLRLNLRVESNSGPIWLEISGPAGTKEHLKSDLGLSRWL